MCSIFRWRILVARRVEKNAEKEGKKGNTKIWRILARAADFDRIWGRLSYRPKRAWANVLKYVLCDIGDEEMGRHVDVWFCVILSVWVVWWG